MIGAVPLLLQVAVAGGLVHGSAASRPGGGPVAMGARGGFVHQPIGVVLAAVGPRRGRARASVRRTVRPAFAGSRSRTRAGSGSRIHARSRSRSQIRARSQVRARSRTPPRTRLSGRARAGRLAADDWFAEDKLKHFFMSLAATNLAYGAVRSVGLEGAPGLVAAGAAAAGLGLWKEWRDEREGGPFSARDLVWDGLGIGVGLFIAAATR